MTSNMLNVMFLQMVRERDNDAGPDLLRTAARYAREHGDVEVARVVASHRNTPADILASLVAHGNPPPLQCQALQNDRTPVDACVEAIGKTRSTVFLGLALQIGNEPVAAAALRRVPQLPHRHHSTLMDRALSNAACAASLELLVPLALEHNYGGVHLAGLVKASGWDYATWAAHTEQYPPQATAHTDAHLVGHWSDPDADATLARRCLPELLDVLATTAGAPLEDQYVERRWTDAVTDLLSANPALAPYIHTRIADRAHLPGQSPAAWDHCRHLAGLATPATAGEPQEPAALADLTEQQARAIAAGQFVSPDVLLAALCAAGRTEGGDPTWWWPLASRTGDDRAARELLWVHAAAIPDVQFAAALASSHAGRDLFSRLAPADQARAARVLLTRPHQLPPNLTLSAYQWDRAVQEADLLAAPVQHVVSLLSGSVKLRDMLACLLTGVLATREQQALFLAMADGFEGTVGQLVGALTGATSHAAA